MGSSDYLYFSDVVYTPQRLFFSKFVKKDEGDTYTSSLGGPPGGPDKMGQVICCSLRNLKSVFKANYIL